MTLSSLLIYTSSALAFVASVFFIIGVAQSDSLFGGMRHVDGTELARLRAVQHADWKCGTGLLGVALVAYAVKLFGTDAYFSESSGNIVGGVVLIAGVVGLVVVIALFVRHVTLSRALRKLD